MNNLSRLKFLLLHSNKWPVILLVGGICLASASASVFAFIKVGRSGSTAAAIASQNPDQKVRTPLVVANLTRFGFEPNAIKVPAGRCVVAIRNLIGNEELNLQIKRRDDGAVLVADKQKTGKRYWERPLEFGVGEYLITEAGNPDWTLQLSVVPPPRQ